MSATATVRARTVAAHARVDAAFSAYDLGERTGYGKFLAAHARALPSAEAFVARHAALPPSRPRTALLACDLAMLSLALPAPLPAPDAVETAFAWGMLYVVEGSRIGGGILAGRVGEGLPAAYLGAQHEPGEWRTFRLAMDAEAEVQGGAWLETAVAGAEACFDLYCRAVLDSDVLPIA